MMKQLLKVWLMTLLLAVLVAAPTMAQAASSGTCGDNLTWTLDDAGTLTISGTGEMEDYSSTDYPNYTTTAPWGTSVKAVVIKEGVTSIGSYAFSGCSSLSSITIPDSVTIIGDWAFCGCSSLSSITIPDSVTNIGSAAFYYCKSLSDVYAADVESWLGISFSNYASNPMYYAAKLYFNGELATDITIPEGVTSIGNSAFYSCENLSSITIPEGVTRIRDGAFFGCSSLSSITIPDSVTSIEGWAFSVCSSLSSITIPDSVTSIGDLAFYGCSSLSSIMLPDNIGSVGSYIFKDCPAVLYVRYGSTTAKKLASSGYKYAVYGTGTCGDNLTWALDTAGTLTISGTGRIPDYTASTGTPWGTDVKKVIIEPGVTHIGTYAFYNCRYLTSVTIPAGVASIGNGAFSLCTMSSIELPAGLTSIGSYAFESCDRLASINLPESLKTIGAYTFKYCNSLASITLPDGMTGMGISVFESCVSLKEVNLGLLASIPAYAFKNCTSLSNIYIPNSVTSIADTAFSGCSLTVYCYEFYYAETWADQHGYPFVLMDELNIALAETLTLGLGQQHTLTYSVFPQLPNAEIAWSTSDEAVATVQDGVVTAVGAGKAVITITINGVSASCTVTVEAPVTALVLPEVIYVVAKQTAQLPVTIVPSNATAQLVYTTGDRVYASVGTDGLITAGALGSTAVTVTDELTGVTATATIRICRPVTSVTFAQASCTLVPDAVLQLIANVTMGTDSCVNELVTFASSDEAVAVVDQHGLLTAKGTGTATITATASNGVSAACTVVVKQPVRSVLPASLTTVDEEAFAGSAVECFVLPDGVQSIGARAFANCTALLSVEIPASVTGIADDAFAGCGIITIIAPEGSVAHTFAVAHGYAWQAK